MTENEARLEALSREECLRRLGEGDVGRVAFVVDDGPVILPVNFRLIDMPSGPMIAVRTQPGNVIERAPTSVAFEIDFIDRVHHRGWSVLVRGELLHARPFADEAKVRYDPEPWLADRDAWLLIDPWEITGREIHGPEPFWPFRAGEYL